MPWTTWLSRRALLAVGLGCMLALPGLEAVVHGGEAAVADQRNAEQRDVDLTRLFICVRSNQATRNLETWDYRREAWHGLKRTGDTVYEASRSRTLLSARGEMRLRVDPRPQGVYLLGAYTADALPLDSVNWLRSHSLAYAEGGFQAGEEIRLSHHSQRVEMQQAAGGVGTVALNGEAMLAEPFQIRVRGEPAQFDEGAGVFRDAWGNPIAVQVHELGDRLRFNVVYTIEHPRDTWVDVRVVFSPAFSVDRFETLRWYGNEDRFTLSPVDKEITSVLCQNPFVIVRSAEGPCLGFLDQDQSNLFFRATPEEASVEYWAWPRERGARYEWTFELIPGYGSYANAFLRALDPHTAGFRRKIRGHAGFLGATRRPEEAAAAGVRAVWYHGCWFHRNGKYFDPQQPLEAEYETAAGQISTYAERIEHIRRAHEAGIKVCMYTQFTGISRPAVGDFESSMVRDLDGDLIRVGHDGKYDNIWANPDPDLPYGRSFVEQVDGMLETFGCDGIAMDRTDRLDNRHGKGLYDLAHFDGSATPFLHGGQHRPCSSMAIQGKRFWQAIRRTLDRHDALWLANVPRSMTIFRLADGVIADIVHSPWNMFFLRAMTGEKNLFAFPRPDRVRGVPEERVGVAQWTRSSALLGSWIRADAMIKMGRGPVGPIDVAQEHPRLLYIVPCGAPYPRYWVFSKGGTKLEYTHDAGASVPARYAGSERIDGS